MGCGESLVVSLTASSMVSGFGGRGAINTLGCTRAESRTGGVGAATIARSTLVCVTLNQKLLTHVVLSPVRAQPLGKSAHRGSSRGIPG
jgi:hypothetical protein